jgi:hypothetical protein
MLISTTASLVLAVIVGCTGRLGRIYPPKVNAAKAAEEAMKQYDANQDGKIDKDELKNCAFFNDLAKDGVVTADAIEGHISQWKDGYGRVGYMARFSRNGKPLQKATIKMIPEKFLGPKVVAAEGVTDSNGGVEMSVPRKSNDEARGIQVGFYRVEVTKEGESIPAKYNAESTLCVHVAGPQGPRAAGFNLMY